MQGYEAGALKGRNILVARDFKCSWRILRALRTSRDVLQTLQTVTIN